MTNVSMWARFALPSRRNRPSPEQRCWVFRFSDRPLSHGMKRESGIWITGIGAVSALGTDFAEISTNLLAGKSGIRDIVSFDVSDHQCRIAAQVSLPPCPPELDATEYDRLFPLEQCAVWCSTQALLDAGLFSQRRELRIGLVLGLAAEWMSHWDTDYFRGGRMFCDSRLGRRPTVETTRGVLNVNGPTATVAAACASGNHALAQACHWLEMGWVDACIAGACDIGVTPCSLASFGNLRALSQRCDAPAAAARPFDLHRDGMVFGEGGAVFLLETAQRARSRRRDAYAEVAGIGMTNDAHHLVIPNPDPTHAIAAIRQAMTIAEVNPEDVDYINANAAGTQVGDASEARVLQKVLGPHYCDVPVSSTKSMTGHLLGAAASMAALACVTAIQQGAIPPTINLDDPDPDCDLCHVPNTAREYPVRVAVANSSGFGGHNTALVLKAAHF